MQKMRYCTHNCTRLEPAMSLITEAAIRKAQRQVAGGKGSVILTDPAPRGAGRLMLVVQPGRAEWYARRFVDGKPRKEKLGAYPSMAIADARQRYQAGPQAAAPTSDRVTLGDMFDGYVESLRKAGKPSADQVDSLLAFAGKQIGRTRLARDVTPADIVAVVKPVFDRGKRVQADKYRMYMGAAFRWAMQATHDYRVDDPKDWGIKVNPVESVPRDTEAEGVGNRWLSESDFRAMLVLADDGRRHRTRSRQAVALLMLTGQRVREILQLRPENWNSAERLLTWEKTKNGLAHVLPVGKRAAAILDSLSPGHGGWLFPNESGPEEHMPDGTVLMWCRRFAKAHGMQPFTGRDLRRTWKTLAGQAGLSKVERDLLQNHAAGDVSARHYDRYDNLKEKRAAVEKWEAWLHQKPGADKARRKAGDVVDDQQHQRL